MFFGKIYMIDTTEANATKAADDANSGTSGNDPSGDNSNSAVNGNGQQMIKRPKQRAASAMAPAALDCYAEEGKV